MAVKREEIEIEGISIILERKNIKNLYLRIKPDGTVKVSSPMRLSDEAINDFISSRIDWIRETQVKMLENPAKPKVKYKDGETHHIWGEPYKLQLISNALHCAGAISFQNAGNLSLNANYRPIQSRDLQTDGRASHPLLSCN